MTDSQLNWCTLILLGLIIFLNLNLSQSINVFIVLTIQVLLTNYLESTIKRGE